jgi:nitroimidazol reductase NimA-like FMN-containing flavoprotein (pyridoxamine 5'-phosphate oxidase superfamily)
MSSSEALALLTALPLLHLASTSAEGTPVFRTVHGVVDGDWVGFHSAPKGEKTSLIGRAAVVCAEEVVAIVPSTFFDAVRACPATTYYRSVQVQGVIEEIDDPARKARILQTLMTKFQPEGGYQPIAHPDGSWDLMYRAAVNGLLVAGVRCAGLTGKAKLAQNRSPEQIRDLLTSLWQRGASGDVRALELIRAANPEAPAPSFLSAPPGLRLHLHLAAVATAPCETTAAEAAALVRAHGGGLVASMDQLASAHLGSAGWAGARDERGELVASGRIIGDSVTYARLCDVVVTPAWRERGAAEAVRCLLRAHPAARGAQVAEGWA